MNGLTQPIDSFIFFPAAGRTSGRDIRTTDQLHAATELISLRGTVTNQQIDCPTDMNNLANQLESPESKEELLGRLADRLVTMGWFAKNSSGLAGTIKFLKQAPEDHIRGLIRGCEERIKNPSCCGTKPHHK